MCGTLKQVLEYAVDAEYIEKNPYRIKVNKKKFVSSNKKPSSKEVFQVDEKERFINEMERRLRNNPSNTAPLAVMLDFELGTRKGEILALSMSDIVGSRIHIHRQLIEVFDTSDINHIKSNGFHVVDYTKSEDGDRYEDFLFVKNGKFLSTDAIDAQIKRGCEYIGIPVRTMHKIRQTYASTTLKHYIYNIEDSTETDNKVLNALVLQNIQKSDQSDQNIIPFAKIKRAGNIEKSTFSAL